MEEKREQKNPSGNGENREERLVQLMEQLKTTENEKKEYAKRQYYMSMVTAACAVLALGIFLAAYMSVIPRVNTAFQEIQAVTETLNAVSDQLSDVLSPFAKFMNRFGG